MLCFIVTFLLFKLFLWAIRPIQDDRAIRLTSCRLLSLSLTCSVSLFFKKNRQRN